MQIANERKQIVFRKGEKTIDFVQFSTPDFRSLPGKHGRGTPPSLDPCIPLIGINVGASGSRHKDSQPQTKGLTNRQPRPQEERSRGPTPTILWHVFQYLVIMTFRRPFRPKSPRRIGN